MKMMTALAKKGAKPGRWLKEVALAEIRNTRFPLGFESMFSGYSGKVILTWKEEA